MEGRLLGGTMSEFSQSNDLFCHLILKIHLSYFSGEIVSSLLVRIYRAFEIFDGV